MFFCDLCAEARRWPKSWAKSVGPCEICGQRARCNDVPSSMLPLPEVDSTPEIRDDVRE